MLPTYFQVSFWTEVSQPSLVMSGFVVREGNSDVSNAKLYKLSRSVQPHPLHSYWPQQHSQHCFKFNSTKFYYTVTSFKLNHIGQACVALNWLFMANCIRRAETLLFSLCDTSVYQVLVWLRILHDLFEMLKFNFMIWSNYLKALKMYI